MFKIAKWSSEPQRAQPGIDQFRHLMDLQRNASILMLVEGHLANSK